MRLSINQRRSIQILQYAGIVHYVALSEEEVKYDGHFQTQRWVMGKIGALYILTKWH